MSCERSCCGDSGNRFKNMETPSIEKLVDFELSKLKDENRLVLDDNLTPFSQRVRNEVNKDGFLFDSPLKQDLNNKSTTLDALNLELIEFPKFHDLKSKETSVDEEEQANRSIDSTDSSDIPLNELEVDDSPMSKNTGYEEMDLLKMFDSKIENADISLEEFPLYEFQPSNLEVIESEEVLAFEENDLSIAARTRHKAKNSPKKATTLKKSKSKIPLPTTTVLQNEIRRSKRLEQAFIESSPLRKVCSPKKRLTNLKPVLRIKSKNSLNFIVDSSTGQLHEATQYATEINANNGEGIPIPKTMNEQVTIPINGPRRSKIPKTAIVRGFSYKIPSAKYLSDNKVGFYSEAAYKSYFSPKNSPNKIVKSYKAEAGSPTKKNKTKKNEKRSVRWAEQLEW